MYASYVLGHEKEPRHVTHFCEAERARLVRLVPTPVSHPLLRCFFFARIRMRSLWPIWAFRKRAVIPTLASPGMCCCPCSL